MLHYKSCYCTCLCRWWGESKAPHNNRLIWSSLAGPLPGAFVYFEPWTTHNNARRTVLLSVCKRQHVICIVSSIWRCHKSDNSNQPFLAIPSIHPYGRRSSDRLLRSLSCRCPSMIVGQYFPIFELCLPFCFHSQRWSIYFQSPYAALRANNIRTVGCSCAKDWSVRECVCVSFFADYKKRAVPLSLI